MSTPGQAVSALTSGQGSFGPGSAVLSWMHEIAPFGIFTTDRDLHIQSWNRWMVTHSGKTSSEVMGRPLMDIYPELGRRSVPDRFKHALQGETSVLSTALHRYLIPMPATLSDPSVPHMLQTAMIAPLPSSDGSPAGTIAIIEDVTQREFQAVVLHRQQEVDRLLSVALATLLQSQEPAQEIGKIFSSLIVALRLDAFFAYLPSADGKKLVLVAGGGIAPKQQETIATLDLTEADRTAMRHPGATALNIGSHVALLQGMGVRSLCSLPLVIGDRIIGMVAIGSYESTDIPAADIGILSRIAGYIAIALDRAAREREVITASKAKDNFLAALSHELRTPLNPVLLLASDAKTNPDFSEAARETFRSIEKNVMLEARLIDDLLDLTRIAHGKVGLEMRELDLNKVVEDAFATIRSELAERELNFHFDLPAGSLRISGDAGRLQQVFWNVIKNSIKFTESGGTIWVRTHVSSDRTEVAVEITDTGIGMDESEIQRIFEAFSQGDHAGHRFGGLGLGLAITRTLVSMHGGRIEARSPGKKRGSSFWIYLPLLTTKTNRGVNPVAPVDVEVSTMALSTSPVSRGKILLVEDHEPTRDALKTLLKRRGFATTAAASFAAALAAAAQDNFNLVLSDIGLPDGDGFVLMRQLRDQYRLKGIALTGYGMEEDEVRSEESGFSAHLTKPIGIETLDQALDKFFPKN